MWRNTPAEQDFKAANEALSKLLGLSNTQKFDQANGVPFTGKDGIQYSWHHHQDGKTMVLVPYEIHRITPHDGGKTIIQELKKNGQDGRGIFPDFKDVQKYLTNCK